ncbi:hypothetical protein RHVP.68 [Cricetid gammaherpesvirus 2]|uniref:Packaging protein UL32 n=1 Tax=Cricetid gammaherpesvirus 2 TaxID=1605972 RepID=E9M5Q2_9GAMA|nr:hypothetical protein RHVP.68 [Cricetid gammaherpesvirus 2]ADW24410.1 hypothetical protein RHVP.68 [Cricetid gammaherpesvirus 2]ADW24492.1 hypothetical protein RHVP-L.68 [Cricetid gammaherpesvirus 2]
MYTPWANTTVSKHRNTLAHVISASYLPDLEETAFENPTLSHITSVLSATVSCAVCDLLLETSRAHAVPDEFFQDYATICFYALHAPVTWSSTVITMADMCEIYEIHFGPCNHLNTGMREGSLLGVNFYLHFFSRRCFQHINPNNLVFLDYENTFKCQLITSCLTGANCVQDFGSSMRACYDGETAQRDFSKLWARHEIQSPPHPSSQSLSPLTAFFTDSKKKSLLSLFSSHWQATRLLDQLPSSKTTASLPLAADPPSDARMSDGPCLISFPFCTREKNNTHGLCVLCECLACHPGAVSALNSLKETILHCLENNSSLLTRTQHILTNIQDSPLIPDPELKIIIQSRSPQEIHKHLFCDMQCAINSARTHPGILFSVPEPLKYSTLQLKLATGQYLDKNILLENQHLELLALAAKTCQLAPVPAKHKGDIIKELYKLARANTEKILSPIHAIHSYV